MADHGTDRDPRAEAALEMLRQGRSDPADAPDDRWAWARDVGERLNQIPRGVGVVVACGVGVVAVVALGWLAFRPVGQAGGAADAPLFSGSAVTTTAPMAGAAAPGTTAAASIVVHAAGAVRSPGIYQLHRGARVADLLDLAGGPALDADLDRVNLAAPLADGQRLYLPRVGEVAPAAVSPDGGGTAGSGQQAEGAAPGSPVDLNAASADQLDALPGVGPATAAAIIDHRERNGPFTSVEGLLDVRGIGPAKLEALRDLVSVG